jgi:hypothetical protein
VSAPAGAPAPWPDVDEGATPTQADAATARSTIDNPAKTFRRIVPTPPYELAAPLSVKLWLRGMSRRLKPLLGN